MEELTAGIKHVCFFGVMGSLCRFTITSQGASGAVGIMSCSRCFGLSSNVVLVPRGGSRAECRGLTPKTIVLLFTPRQGSTLLLEICEADRRQRSGCMMFSSIVVDLVNWYCCMNDRWLDGLLVDYRLDGL